MAIDITAPIIPCGGVASIVLGMDIQLTVPSVEQDFVSEPVPHSGDLGTTRYRSACVDVWTDKNGTIWQVMVHDGYAGKVLGKIGLGSTLKDIETSLGKLAIIDENMVVKGLPGISFESEVDEQDSPVIEIYVWKPDPFEIRQHQSH